MNSSVGQALPHDTADRHVQGNAQYTDDVDLVANTLHAAIGQSPVAHGLLRHLDLTAVRNYPGVVDLVDASSILGNANIGSVLADENLFAAKKVEFAGQAVFAVAAHTMAQARKAVRLAKFSIRELPTILTIEKALAAKSYIIPVQDLPEITNGWKPAIMRRSPYALKGQVYSGAQEHFYLEGQVAYALPQDGGKMLIHTSTQHPSEIQHIVAGVLAVPLHMVEVRVRRMGGGFGGKETQGVQPAAIAALLAKRTGQPVKLRLPRADDFTLTGKRHPFLSEYQVGFDGQGRILAADFRLAADCGLSADLSLAILDRALFHVDNAYHLPCVRIRGYPCRTHKVSNTAFRGFGGPQGMLLIERVMEDIARHLQLDPWTVRQRNLYQGRRQRTPYGQILSDNILPELLDQLATNSNYSRRRKDIARFNRSSPYIKKGIALTPVKFGISFTATFLNQAGALVNVYRDGTIALNHGGTEMGQGLFIKVAQVVATTFGVPLASVCNEATSTAKVPNTSATAASAGSDLNGKAAESAALTVRNRLARFAANLASCKPAAVEFTDGKVVAGHQSWLFADLVAQAYMAQVQLSATGYYTTPKIHLDRKTLTGRPFFYFSYGGAVSEVIVDTLTGEHRLTQVDILHDVGQSINPAIDMGQVEGGFAQGYGWLTSEELSWDDKGCLQVRGPATYKIPAAGDLPAKFNVAYWTQPNIEDTIYRSKAVGEPPLMLAISAWAALADAVAAASGNGPQQVVLHAPATPERMLFAITERNKST